MGTYTEKFRQLTDSLPSTPEEFKNPLQASAAMAKLKNATLQVLAALEEALEDGAKERERLEELIMENSSPGWKP